MYRQDSMESQGKTCYSGRRLRYAQREAENTAGRSRSAETTMLDILFPDGCHQRGERKCWKFIQEAIPTAGYVGRGYFAVIIAATFASGWPAENSGSRGCVGYILNET